ncbi:MULTISPECIES: hypothetical protein [unclassified Caballeronia]|uniref:hypothetical protein n=1 Tax=unclassified Caballeronia TaxID=2646786 RepID=UPI00285F4105|nr:MULTISPECIES: hypothetical protein [unclassified Caballeronia]MDR5739911.1 hypothetical protein [Caballeronia sp. LZ016]MDR5808377.1 hypothetical protein [Caballeronia sp. LZ019]
MTDLLLSLYSEFSFLGIGAHVIIALFFAYHAVRNRQEMYWLYILFVFPLLGSVVYFFAIYLPDLKHSHRARAATRTVTRFIDPNRAVREARNDLDRAPSVQHRLRLGQALLAAGKAQESLEHLEQAASGPFADDPALLRTLADAQFSAQQPAAANATLNKLFSILPAARQEPEASLLHARTLAALQLPEARDAFERALTCASDAAPRCLYGEWLLKRDDAQDTTRAKALFADILRDAQHWPRYAKQHNREWIDRARAATAKA